MIHIDSMIGSVELANHLPQGRYNIGSYPTDFIIEGETTIGIERKVVTDYIQSFTSGRLHQQLETLTQFKLRFILIEGVFKGQDNHLMLMKWGKWFAYEFNHGYYQYDSFLGSQLTLLLECGVVPLYSSSIENTAQVLLAFDNWVQKAEHKSHMKTYLGGEKPWKLSLTQKLAMQLPGVGVDKASAIAAHGLAWLAEGLLTNDGRWQEVEGIGKGINKRITEKIKEEL